MNQTKKYQRNIKLLYAISFVNYLWFWLGVWALYYLLFTDYIGIGWIETAMIVTVTLFEIPSGALADLLGRKTTLLLAFAIITIGNLMEAVAFDFWILFIAASVCALGSTMISGTFEAMTYDTLLKLKQENIYDKVLAKQKGLQYLAQALATLAGGFMYNYIGPRTPFLAVAITSFVALVLTLFLTEPTFIKKVTFSWDNYKKQFALGFKELFKDKNRRTITFILLAGSIIPLIIYEMVTDLLLVSYTNNAVLVSIGVVIMLLAVAVFAPLEKYFSKLTTNSVKLIFALSIFYALLLLIVPWLNFPLAVALGSCLSVLSIMIQIFSSKIINEEVKSSDRATSLSTFNALISIPYIFSAVLIGDAINNSSAPVVTFELGVIMLLMIILVGVYRLKSRPSNISQ